MKDNLYEDIILDVARIVKRHLNESVQDGNKRLLEYFRKAQQDDPEWKISTVIDRFPDFIEMFCRKVYKKYPDFEKLLVPEDQYDTFNGYPEGVPSEFIRLLMKNSLDDKFLEAVDNYEVTRNLPSWITMQLLEPIHDQWCIHFCPDAYSIAKNGFTDGIPDINALNYTGGNKRTYTPGYNFAYLPDSLNIDMNGYGNQAVVFKTDGVKIFHTSDNESQAVFWGPDAHDIIPIKKDSENGHWVLTAKDGSMEKEKASELFAWIREHYKK